jgi:predicted membrane channel-forming protein YqfA (hemolysin III family)
MQDAHFTIYTNLAFALPIGVALLQWDAIKFVAFSYVMVASWLMHACYDDGQCGAGSREQLGRADHIASLWLMTTLLTTFHALPGLAWEAALELFFLLCVVVVTDGHLNRFGWYAGLGAFAAIAVALTWCLPWSRYPMVRPNTYWLGWRALVGGIACLLAGAVLYGLEYAGPLRWNARSHGAWHMLAAVGATGLMVSLRWRVREDWYETCGQFWSRYEHQRDQHKQESVELLTKN